MTNSENILKMNNDQLADVIKCQYDQCPFIEDWGDGKHCHDCCLNWLNMKKSISR